MNLGLPVFPEWFIKLLAYIVLTFAIIGFIVTMGAAIHQIAQHVTFK